MLKLAFIILFSGLISTMAQAQESSIFEAPIQIPCDIKSKMVSVMEDEYGERRMALGQGSIHLLPNNTPIVGTLTIWVNPQTYSYSITIESPTGDNDSMMCMIMSGDEFRPAGGTDL